MKNALTLFAASLLIISSCKDKEKEEGSTPPPPTHTVTGISLKTASRIMEEKETFKLEAIITPEDADKSIEWDSNNKNAATVAADGVVTAVKAGKATITAKSKSNTSLKAAECLITVVAKKVPATAITINPAPASVLVGQTQQLNAIMTPLEATDIVEWASSDKDKATVSSTGLVEGKVAGTVTITATSAGNPSIKGECKLTVTTTPIAVTGLSLTPDKVTLATVKTQSVEKTRQLTITIEPSTATNRKVTCKSDNEGVASVSGEGLITANSGGTANITVTTEDGGKTATCAVTVTVPVATITLGPAQAKVAIGEAEALTLTVDVKPDNASNKALTWKSSKQEAATVAQEGDKVKVTGVSAGTTTITATAADGSGVTGELLVTVQNNQATLSAIELGAEKFNVAVPTAGGTTTVANAPHTISSILSQVPVTLTASDKATFKTGETDFTSGQPVNFSNGAVTFKVISEDGKLTQSYTVAITAYDATNNPYGVYTAAHLNDVRNNKDDSNNITGSYKMMNDIRLPERNEEGKAAIGINDYIEKGWLPIADDATVSGTTVTRGFTGIFDGGGFSVDNIYINRSTDYVGLFAVASGATLKNLGVNGTASPAVTGFRFVGALVGIIKGGIVANCYASANVSLTTTASNIPRPNVGGLLGNSTGTTISNSYSSGNISGNLTVQQLIIGGFAGSIDGGTITNCFATGNITATSQGSLYGGGLAGQLSPTTASNCYATGDVTATASISYLAKLAVDGGSESSTTSYTNCYRNSDAALTMSGRGEKADVSSSGIVDKTKGQMQSDDFKGLLNGSGNVWAYDANKNGGFPYIKGVGVGKN